VLNSSHVVSAVHSAIHQIACEVRRSYRTARRDNMSRRAARKLARSYRDSLVRRYMRTAYPDLLMIEAGSNHSYNGVIQA
jgi:hypothetical protein